MCIGRFWNHVVFPYVLDRALSGGPFDEARERLLADAHGSVLDIGFGTGLNLPHYPNHIEHLTIIDVNDAMPGYARKRMEAAPFPVDLSILDAETLPFDDERFDTVVSTWTLCSILHAGKALREFRRVLKPGGRFLFFEHGRSPDRGVRMVQDALTPLQRVVADGCHLNRDMEGLIRSGGFTLERLEKGYMRTIPRFGGYMYHGVARK